MSKEWICQWVTRESDVPKRLDEGCELKPSAGHHRAHAPLLAVREVKETA